MPRASATEHARRLNFALDGLRQGLSPAEAAGRLAASARISRRQAHRYVEGARRLKAPVPAVEPKIVFTVKLPERLVERLHQYAGTTGEALGAIVARALSALLGGGGGHG
jgi:hypothetical protein